MWTTRNAVFINDIINTFDFELSFERDIGFFNGSILKQVFINFDGIKSGITKKSFRTDQRMFFEKIL